MDFYSAYRTINSAILTKKRIHLPFPYLAKAYFLDYKQNLHFCGGFPSHDFFISKNEYFAKNYLFSRYRIDKFSNIYQGASVTVNFSGLFSNLISFGYIDPRFNMSSLNRLALGHNYLTYLELKLRASLSRGVFSTGQSPVGRVRIGYYPYIYTLGFRPRKIRWPYTVKFCQSLYLRHSFLSIYSRIALYSNKLFNYKQKKLFKRYSFFLNF